MVEVSEEQSRGSCHPNRALQSFPRLLAILQLSALVRPPFGGTGGSLVDRCPGRVVSTIPEPFPVTSLLAAVCARRAVLVTHSREASFPHRSLPWCLRVSLPVLARSDGALVSYPYQTNPRLSSGQTIPDAVGSTVAVPYTPHAPWWCQRRTPLSVCRRRRLLRRVRGTQWAGDGLVWTVRRDGGDSPSPWLVY